MNDYDWTTFTVLIMILVLALISIISKSDYKDIDQNIYCQMVSDWNSNLHLPPEDRPGWPPYKGECDGAE